MRATKLFACFCLAASSVAQGSEPQQASVLVPGFGKISAVPGAANLPDRNLHYRVLFSVTKAADAPAKVNPSLEKVARFFNLLGSEGVVPRQKDVVIILHGSATPVVLTDEAYRARYGVPNPNLALIRALGSAGAAIHVCGQALHAQKIDRAAVSPEVIVDLSAMTTIATLQLKGWALMPD